MWHRAIVTLISIAAVWAPGGVIFGPNICIWWPQRVAIWGQLTPSQNHNHPEPRVRLSWQYKLRGKENIGMILSPGRNLKSWNLTIRLFVGLAMPHTQNDNFFNFLPQLGRSFKHSSLCVLCFVRPRHATGSGRRVTILKMRHNFHLCLQNLLWIAAEVHWWAKYDQDY